MQNTHKQSLDSIGLCPAIKGVLFLTSKQSLSLVHHDLLSIMYDGKHDASLACLFHQLSSARLCVQERKRAWLEGRRSVGLG